MNEKSNMNAHKQPFKPGMSINKIKMVNYVAEILYASKDPPVRRLERQLNSCGLRGELASLLITALKTTKEACSSRKGASRCIRPNADDFRERMRIVLGKASLWLSFHAEKCNIRWGWC